MHAHQGSAETHDSKADFAPRGEVSSASNAVEIVRAHAGDHLLVHQLLLAVHQRPTHEEFQASIDDPHYDPSDRLLLRRDELIVAHVHLTKRQMLFGQVQLPIAEVEWLAVLPEYHTAGYDRQLLEQADQQMRDEGAVLAVLQTKTPEAFASAGWIACGQPTYLRVGACELLAALAEPASTESPVKFTTRRFRQVELLSLMQLYDQHFAGQYGPLQRDELYWRWLVNRQAYEQILVAIEGDDTFDFGPLAPTIVGYAVLYGDQLVELVPAVEHPAAAAQLLASACREAIERDHHTLLVHATAEDPLYQVMKAAGGVPCPGPERLGETTTLKVLDEDELLRRLYPEFHHRGKDLARPFHLRWQIDGEPYRFVLTRRSLRLEQEPPGPWDVQSTRQQFWRMLLGQFAIETALEEKQIKVRNKTLGKQLRTLFPRLELRRPPFDRLES